MTVFLLSDDCLNNAYILLMAQTGKKEYKRTPFVN